MIRVWAEQALQRIWYGDAAFSTLLSPVARLYGWAIRLRRLAYRRGWLVSQRMRVPVIVVGNITAGGTGKTPVVIWLTNALRGAGHRPGVAIRGYGGKTHRGPLLVSAGSGSDQVGDEALLLFRRTAGPVAVCVDRVRACERLAAAGVSVILCDDGLQHYRLDRDLEIAVVDGERGLGNGRLLPAGPLREAPGRLDEVDLVLVHARSDTNRGASFMLVGETAINLATAKEEPLAGFAGRKVWAVAGIGHPGRFVSHLVRHGLDPVAVPVADHGRIELDRLRRDSNWPIVMTEKDAVKYPSCLTPDVWYVPVDLAMTHDSESAIMEQILAVLDKCRSGATAAPA